jgi:hypothetical protein
MVEFSPDISSALSTDNLKVSYAALDSPSNRPPIESKISPSQLPRFDKVRRSFTNNLASFSASRLAPLELLELEEELLDDEVEEDELELLDDELLELDELFDDELLELEELLELDEPVSTPPDELELLDDPTMMSPDDELLLDEDELELLELDDDELELEELLLELEDELPP